MQKKEELGLSPDQKCILILDCWFGHISDEFRSWVKRMYPWLILLYIPACCTSELQPCDVGVNKILKVATATAFLKSLSKTLMKVGDGHGLPSKSP